MNSGRYEYMKKRYLNKRNMQRGVVLFFALIALVVMSLAAAALIRSVDTGGIIAGNLAFRRSGVLSSDHGVETSIAWLKAQSSAALENDIVANGYYATSILPPGYADVKAFVDVVGRPASGVGIDASGQDASGNTITYVVQRMCRNTGGATEENCILGPGKSLPNHSMADPPPLVKSNSKSPLYRITARVIGPKDTLSYIQAFVS